MLEAHGARWPSRTSNPSASRLDRDGWVRLPHASATCLLNERWRASVFRRSYAAEDFDSVPSGQIQISPAGRTRLSWKRSAFSQRPIGHGVVSGRSRCRSARLMQASRYRQMRPSVSDKAASQISQRRVALQSIPRLPFNCRDLTGGRGGRAHYPSKSVWPLAKVNNS